jgi:anti-sigma-K factor RskA
VKSGVGGDNNVTGKRIAAVLLFAIGALIGASTKTNLWDGYPFWVWLLVLFSAIAICGAALEMWRSVKTSKLGS